MGLFWGVYFGGFNLQSEFCTCINIAARFLTVNKLKYFITSKFYSNWIVKFVFLNAHTRIARVRRTIRVSAANEGHISCITSGCCGIRLTGLWREEGALNYL